MNLLLRGFLDLLYPPRCEACGRLRREPICRECLAAIRRVEPPLCEVCGEPFDPLAQAPARCQRCRAGRRPFSVARGAAYYEGPLVQAILRFKYHSQMVLGRPLGKLMVEALGGTSAAGLNPQTIDVVCPVPLHRSRLRERGFNQSELLAEEVAAAIERPLKHLLERTKPTLPQVDLPVQSRAANVRDAFAPRLQEVIGGQRVLLVDDLFTTGATLAECARALRRAEAAEVRVFALARPLPLWRRPAADARNAASDRKRTRGDPVGGGWVLAATSPMGNLSNMSAARRQVQVKGIVQGVGFRPFVFRLASSLDLAGSVRNTPEGVAIEIEGTPERVEDFLRRLPAEAPPLARIGSVQTRELRPAGLAGFRIIESAPGERPTALIPPDVALCGDCAREMADPNDRRFGYPFTNCTSCGPRFSIVLGIPYDRPQTTMAGFELCGDCAGEYGNPSDRRFHAEPVACPACGPSLLLDGEGAPDAISRVAGWLWEGKVVAIKGLGGYHLACDARNAEAVETLRTRKGRGQKPFAIMVCDMDEARRVAEVSGRAEALLTSPESPVVIMPAKAGSGLVEGIAPRQKTVGAMLPYTPLHRLLMEQSPPALVMTSGNLAEEPIEHRDEEAKQKFERIADHILSHNREIAVPCDDSVVRVAGDLVIPVRRARGYVPRSVTVDVKGPAVLAVGGQQKNTFCLLREGEAVLSQHIGDLDTAEVLDYFGRAVRHFEELFEVKPEIVAHDLHPGYLSTQWAQSLDGVRLVPVQHHHAHVVSVMAELGLEGPVIGVSYDGTGYGSDGTIWGGEVLVADRRGFDRSAHLRQVRLPGGERAIRRPARMALSHLVDAFGAEEGIEKARRLMPYVTESEVGVVVRQVERGINSPVCSSMGRLFDAVAAMLEATPEATYEGQPAMELEAMCDRAPAEGRPYEYCFGEGIVDTRPVVRGVVEDVERGMDMGAIAARFHETVAAFTVHVCQRIRDAGGPSDVVLCGGVMQNARLVERLLELLPEAGLRGHVHEEVPPNDGGMSLGQAVVAAESRKQS